MCQHVTVRVESPVPGLRKAVFVRVLPFDLTPRSGYTDSQATHYSIGRWYFKNPDTGLNDEVARVCAFFKGRLPTMGDEREVSLSDLYVVNADGAVCDVVRF